MNELIGKGDLLDIKDLIEGATLLVDKPLGWTSFDVVNKLRWKIRNKLDRKKYKVGHAGTLDPLATGLLIICISKHTKLISKYVGLTKSYEGHFRMFATTPTYDAEMSPDCYWPHRIIEVREFEKAAKSFLGSIGQYPPIYAAIKKNGVPLYRMARKGMDVALELRQVHIERFDVVSWVDPVGAFRVTCSKGTYIRSLIHDMGKKMDSGAYLTQLRRTAIGTYGVDDAWELNQLLTKIDEL